MSSTSIEPKRMNTVPENQEQEQDKEEAVTHVADRVKLYEANVKTSSTTPTHSRRNNNNGNNNNVHHVVPVVVLVVVFTLYFTATTLTRNYTDKRERANALERTERETRFQEMHELESNRRAKILAKLLEYKDLCTELEIFTKDLRWIDDQFNGSCESDCDNGDYVDDDEDVSGDDAAGVDNHKAGLLVTSSSGGSGGGQTPPKVNNQKLRGKRNGQRHSNKSMKIKNTRIKHEGTNNHNNKKEQTAKKSSTAEPIIYLFALVFIYLLLKAASDINQHYKSQTKGDKRMRRCSLQSYAQTHKQDRRASKESPRNPNRQLLAEMRSKSVDRCNDPATVEELARKKSEILANLRKYTSLDEQPQRLIHSRYAANYSGWDTPLTAEGRQSGENIALNTTINFGGIRTEFVAVSASNRRCSVPVSLNYQRQKLSAMPLATISTMTARRTSISGATDASIHGDHAMDPQCQEVKRRVRMINRH